MTAVAATLFRRVDSLFYGTLRLETQFFYFLGKKSCGLKGWDVYVNLCRVMVADLSENRLFQYLKPLISCNLCCGL